MRKIHITSCDLIASTGHETKAFLNNNGPRYKRSKLERQMNADVLWCVLILLIMCLFSAIGKCSLKEET